MMRTVASAADDIHAGLRMRPVWMALAQEDIGDQHRRTALGPVWLLINYLAYAGAFVVIFGHGNPTPNYPAYVAIGLFVWFYILEVVNQSVTLFEREESFIKGTTLPLTVYVMRLTTQSMIRAAFALTGCLTILLLEGTPMTAGWFVAAVALVLILLATPAVVTVFATIGAFFPDTRFIVQNIMRLSIFLTPVFWVHAGGSIRDIFYYWKPFTYFLEIVRVPVISGEIPVRSFLLCATLTFILWCVAITFVGRLRKQIVFAV